MKALILAAGRGSRMGALTDDRPKGLTELGGRSLIARAAESLTRGGCDQIGIVTGYRSESVAALASMSFHNARWAQTNMVVSLICAGAWLREAPVIVSYSDIFYTAETVASLIRADGPVALAYDPDWRSLWEERFGDPLSDAESFRLDARSCLIDIGRKHVTYGDIDGQYMGLLKITPDAWADILAVTGGMPAERRDRLDMTSLLSFLISRGMPIEAVARKGSWGECDTESDLEIYRRWLAERRLD